MFAVDAVFLRLKHSHYFSWVHNWLLWICSGSPLCRSETNGKAFWLRPRLQAWALPLAVALGAWRWHTLHPGRRCFQILIAVWCQPSKDSGAGTEQAGRGVLRLTVQPNSVLPLCQNHLILLLKAFFSCTFFPGDVYLPPKRQSCFFKCCWCWDTLCAFNRHVQPAAAQSCW